MARLTNLRLCLYDRPAPSFPGWWVHVCWGPIDPAHVGDHQAQGAPDLGVLASLCRGAHRFYDEHRSEWERVTGYSEADMENLAAGYALKFVERGGTL